MTSPYANKSSTGKRRQQQQQHHGEKISYEPIQILASFTITKDDSYLRPFSISTSKQEVGVGAARETKANA